MILQILVYISYIVLFLFATTCLASGLIYLAELVEEYAFLTKKIIRYTIFAVVVLHVLMWIFEDVGTKEVILGLVAHAAYYQLLREFPLVTLMSVKFIASVALLLLNHGLWFWFFRENYLPFAQILSIFFLCVWLVPFAFFVSLSANENTLPYANPTIATATGEYTTSAKRGKTVGILLSIFTFFKRKSEDWIPQVGRGGGHKSL
eukprot:Phypoly_transcript_19082.p1 GENE.Phypoly_transcript_19082~~Phypoly_transcript_19082.p1  ORF type:complete len:205 (+),score=14.60 Phypoly_transcript_19082:109-723(+)